MNRIDTSEFRCLTYSIQGEFSPRLSEHEPGIETYAFVITLDPDRISPGSDEWEVEVEIEREDAGGERTLLLTRRLWVERAEDASEMQLHASHPEIRHVFLEAAGLDESFEGSLDVTTYLSEQSCLHPTDSEQHLKMEHGWTYSSYEGRVWVSEPFKAYVKVSSRTGGRHTNSCSF